MAADCAVDAPYVLHKTSAVISTLDVANQAVIKLILRACRSVGNLSLMVCLT